MLKQLFLFLVSIISFGLVNGQSNLVGSWRRLQPNGGLKEQIQPGPYFGDLIIRSDSTFQIAGDSPLNRSDLPGWHVGDRYKGRWELHSRQLTLRLFPEDEGMFQTYTIVKLTKKRLVLRSSFNLDNSKFDITYQRR
jgi:hypothetical protein